MVILPQIPISTESRFTPTSPLHIANPGRFDIISHSFSVTVGTNYAIYLQTGVIYLQAGIFVAKLGQAGGDKVGRRPIKASRQQKRICP